METSKTHLFSDEEKAIRRDQLQTEIIDTTDICKRNHWKKPSFESVRRWRRAAVMLDASRRFRYALNTANINVDIGRPTEGDASPRTRFRVYGHTICACSRLQNAVQYKPLNLLQDDDGGSASVADSLVQLLQDRRLEDLQALGGVEGLAKLLSTDLENGLDETEEQIQSRRETYGANAYPKMSTKGFWSFVWNACKDTTLIILMVCAVVSLGTGIWTDGVQKGWYEGTSIGVAVFLVIAVTAISDYKQGLQFQNLNEEKENIQLPVVRGGREQTVSIFELVAGDIVPLSIGGQVPADGVLVEGHSLAIDESAMTGESLPVKKDKSNPFMLSGCKVQDGQGVMVVTGVGLKTEWGQVMASISRDEEDDTPLQVRLNGVATLIGKAGLFVATLVFIVLIIRYFAITFKNASAGDRQVMQVIKELVHVFSIAVTIVVVAVPEGLPLAVTLTLAYSMRKMMADKALVRKLAACETMGSATTICSDKTGTLTTNEMTVTKAWVAGEMREPDSDSIPQTLRQSLTQSICLNSSGTVSPPKGNAKQVVTGTPTEAALLSWGVKLGMKFKQIRHECRILHVETFNSETKRMGVAYKTVNGDVEVHWKGAAELILERCTKYWGDTTGIPRLMTDETREELRVLIEGMAAQALRCIAFAYRPLENLSDDVPYPDWKLPDTNLTLMATVGIKDPCRPGVRQAVEKCQKAGVKVRMVTGDNAFTAKAIAAECGILNTTTTTAVEQQQQQLVVEGRDFRNWDDARMNKDLGNLVVMARSSPTDKLKLVEALKKYKGDVVAVTGDGTNDAPALKEADIGLSMGIAGTEVAKEASDIIILDDDFTSVVKVVRWGRSVYANIQKFIQFQLTVNVVALTINFMAAVTSGEVPLTAVQLLWVNLIMDTMGALALATEAPTDDLMDRDPVGRSEPLITNIMWRNILGQAMYQIAILLTLTYAGIQILGLQGRGSTSADQTLTRNTIIFNAFVFCQIFNEVNSRRPEALNVFQGIHKNYLFLGILVVTVLFQFIIVEFLNNFTDTTKLPLKWWLLPVAIGSVALPLAAVLKCIPVPRKPIFEMSCFPSKPSWFRFKRRRRNYESASARHEHSASSLSSVSS